MYCAKCGAEIEDRASFCPYCGEKVNKPNGRATERVYATGSEAKRRKPIIFAAVVGAAAAIILLWAVIGNMGYKSVVSKYFESIEKNNPSLLLSITSETWAEYMERGWYLDEEDLCELMEEEIWEEIDDYGCGDNIKIQYRITDVYKPNADELDELEDDVYEWFGYYLYDRDEFRLDAARSLEIQYTVTGGGNETDWTLSNFVVIKENGRWRMLRGGMSGSWY